MIRQLHGRWTEENRAVLEGLLARNSSSMPTAPQIAVFDWDNTCIRGDIANSVFHQLCAELAFKFDAPGFWEWITEVTVQDHVRDAYELLCAQPTAENRLRLRLRFEQLRKSLLEGEDDTAAWAWDSGAFVGWRESEARDFVERVIARELTRPLTTEILTLDGEDSVELNWGLRMYAEVKELVSALRDAGWQVCVNSGSPRWEVEPFAARFGFPPERIIGMQREIVDGVITATIKPPVCIGDGKLGAYYLCISRTQAPTLVAGDSLGDWKLLESAEEARLLIEPLPTGLRNFAEWRKSQGEKWLVQEFKNEG